MPQAAFKYLYFTIYPRLHYLDRIFLSTSYSSAAHATSNYLAALAY